MQSKNRSPWNLSDVSFEFAGIRGGLYATVSRRANLKNQTGPNISFDATRGDTRNLFLLDDEMAGSILIAVRELSRPVEGDEDDWSETIEYSHVYTSSEALKCCDVLHADRHGNIGKLELRPLVDKKNADKKRPHVYHGGDAAFKTDIRKIIGVVRWIPQTYIGEKIPATYFTENKRSDLVYVGPYFNQAVLNKAT